MRKIFTLFLSIALYCLFTPGTGLTATYIVEAQNIGDGYYHWHNGPGKEWRGSDSYINVSYPSSYSGYEDTGYSQYDLSGAPDSSLIDSVSLNLNLSLKDVYCYGFIRYLPNATGANGHASQRLNGTQTVGTISTASEIGWLSFDVTDLIKTDLENGLSWAPFSFHASHSGYTGYRFKSAESGDASYLEFTYTPVPVPGAVWLLGSGLIGLAAFRKRRQ